MAHQTTNLITFITAVLFTSSYAQDSYYCANVGVSVGGSVPSTSQGYFSMKIGDGYAKYSFDVDLSGTDACDFSTYSDVSYHIHTYSITDTNAIPEISCANAAGHYDPTLACSGSSQAKSGYCTDLGRTSTQGYSYACSSATNTVSYTNPTGNCELGDLSGKLGKVTVDSSSSISSTQVYTDYQPPYEYNYNNPTVNITAGWASVVFHCGDGTRIACGDFALTTASGSASCSFSGESWVNNESSCSSDDDSADVSQSEYAGLVAVLVLGWLAAIGLGIYAFMCRSAAGGSGDKATMMNSSL